MGILAAFCNGVGIQKEAECIQFLVYEESRVYQYIQSCSLYFTYQVVKYSSTYYNTTGQSDS